MTKAKNRYFAIVSRHGMSIGTRAQPAQAHVEQHDGGDAGDDRREDEDDRHQRRRPPGIGLDRSEDEADVAVQQERRRDADDRDEAADLVVDTKGFGADVVRPERQRAVELPLQPGAGLPGEHQVLAVVEPDLEDEDAHQVPQVDEAEHRHGRFAMRRDVHLERALRMAEVHLQRQRRDDEKRQSREERQPVGWLHGRHVEHALERREDERARHEPGDKRIQDDEDAPLELDLVRIDEALNASHDHLSANGAVQAVVVHLGSGRQVAA